MEALPAGFSMGVGASDVALDGPAPASDLGAARSTTAGQGAGFAEQAPDDLAAWADLGIGDVRLPIEWARLEPVMQRHDRAAVDQQRRVLEAARGCGLRTWACLHDGTLPGWFAHDERGFADVRTRSYHWSRHVEWVAETFGDLVHGWIPTHEPNRWAYRGWITGRRPPGAVDDVQSFAAALEGVLVASVDAARRLRGQGQPVASSHMALPLFAVGPDPVTRPSPTAESMASLVDEAMWGCWRRLLVEEVLVVGRRAPLEVPGARDAFDLVGLAYRHGAGVDEEGVQHPYPQGVPAGMDGQVPWVEGLSLSLRRAAAELPDRDLVVTGFGIATRDEDLRWAYLRDGLRLIAEAAAEGVAVRGLLWQNPIDPAPEAGVGLYDHDRSPRPAADLLSSVAHGDAIPA